MSDPATPSRREFAAVAVAAALPCVASPADEKPPAKSPGDLLFDLFQARHGKHLDERQLAAVKGSLQRQLALGEFLRRNPLANGDDPATAFYADLP